MVEPGDCVPRPEGLTRDRERWQHVAENSGQKGVLVFT